MKTTLNNLLYFCLLMAISLSSCKKDDVEPVIEPSNEFIAVIDGKFFATKAQCEFDGVNYIIKASKGLFAGKLFEITFSEDTVVGTYSFNNVIQTERYAFAIYANYQNMGDIYSYLAESGTLNITMMNPITKKISGTFNFEALSMDDDTSVKKITHGSFTNVSIDEYSDYKK